MFPDQFGTAKEFAETLDRRDRLACYRKEFYLKPGTIYLDGNSLGLLSKRAEQSLLATLADWKEKGIEGWTHARDPWFFMSEKLGMLSAPLVGALEKEIIVSASTTVNLHQLAATFFKPAGKRTKILADELTFPSDIYALQSQLRIHGLDHEKHLIRIKSKDGRFLDEQDIVDAMTEEVGLIVLPAVLYRSGQVLDMEYLTKEAHKRGIVIGFDCCHSIGAIPHYFDKWKVDFAFWCTYKHLNGGPGSAGGIYVNQKHFGIMPGLAGWFGSKKERQFDMDHTFHPEESAGGFQIGTPHVLSMAPLVGSLEMFMDAGIENIREKSLGLTQYLIKLVEAELSEHQFTIGSPRDGKQRGGHVALEHREAARICKALKAEGVIPDYREPNIIRLAPVALYTSYSDVWETILILKKIMDEKQYERYENKRGVVA